MAKVKSMEHEKPTEDESDVKIPLTNGGSPENGPDRLGTREYLNSEEQGGSQKFEKKTIKVLLLLLLVSVTGNIIQAVQKGNLQAPPGPSDGCFHGWIRQGDWCYFFSDEQQNWDFSHSNCSSYGASLVSLDSEEEWALIKSKENEYWILLQREKADEPWKWPNGSIVTEFDIRGTGFCGYVSNDMVSSTTCDNIRHWICRKPVRSV